MNKYLEQIKKRRLKNKTQFLSEHIEILPKNKNITKEDEFSSLYDWIGNKLKLNDKNELNNSESNQIDESKISIKKIKESNKISLEPQIKNNIFLENYLIFTKNFSKIQEFSEINKFLISTTYCDNTIISYLKNLLNFEDIKSKDFLNSFLNAYLYVSKIIEIHEGKKSYFECKNHNLENKKFASTISDYNLLKNPLQILRNLLFEKIKKYKFLQKSSILKTGCFITQIPLIDKMIITSQNDFCLSYLSTFFKIYRDSPDKDFFSEFVHIFTNKFLENRNLILKFLNENENNFLKIQNNENKINSVFFELHKYEFNFLKNIFLKDTLLKSPNHLIGIILSYLNSKIHLIPKKRIENVQIFFPKFFLNDFFRNIIIKEINNFENVKNALIMNKKIKIFLDFVQVESIKDVYKIITSEPLNFDHSKEILKWLNGILRTIAFKTENYKIKEDQNLEKKDSPNIFNLNIYRFKETVDLLAFLLKEIENKFLMRFIIEFIDMLENLFEKINLYFTNIIEKYKKSKDYSNNEKKMNILPQNELHSVILNENIKKEFEYDFEDSEMFINFITDIYNEKNYYILEKILKIYSMLEKEHDVINNDKKKKKPGNFHEFRYKKKYTTFLSKVREHEQVINNFLKFLKKDKEYKILRDRGLAYK